MAVFSFQPCVCLSAVVCAIAPPSAGGGDELRGWEASALSRIGLKYVRSRDDLAWYLGSLHTLERRQWPTVIAGKQRKKKPKGGATYLFAYIGHGACVLVEPS